MVILSASAPAQEAIWGGPELVSPQIHEDRTVTFLLDAPGAGEVLISGEWMPAEGFVPGSVAMQKNENGTWSHTTGVLEPELYGYFYTVDGLRVIDPLNPFQFRDIATLSSIFIIPGPTADLYRVMDVPHGTVSKRWYDSPGLGMDRRLTIYTPPGYETSGESYPVLYLLHGAGGDEEAWPTKGRVPQIMDNLIASGEAVPMIVVMPNGNVIQDAASGEGSEGFYKPRFMVPRTMDGTFEETFSDIMQFVENNYRVLPDKGDRAVAGLSMGGFHALHISRYYPDTFDYIGLFSAALVPGFNSGSPVYRDVDATLKRQMDNGYRLYLIAIGKEDFLYDNNRQFMKKLDAMGMPYEFVESEGGHIWKNWRSYLTQFVPKLFK